MSDKKEVPCARCGEPVLEEELSWHYLCPHCHNELFNKKEGSN